MVKIESPTPPHGLWVCAELLSYLGKRAARFQGFDFIVGNSRFSTRAGKCRTIGGERKAILVQRAVPGDPQKLREKNNEKLFGNSLSRVGNRRCSAGFRPTKRFGRSKN